MIESSKQSIDQFNLSQLTEDPDCITETIRLRSGDPITVRLVAPTDVVLLGRYFEDLSAETRRRYGPHPLTRAEAENLCGQGLSGGKLRLIALANNGAGRDQEVIAYFILDLVIPEVEMERYRDYGILLDPRLTCRLAPSVADAYQDQGVGSAVLPKVLDLARRLGYRQMILFGGTQATNHRAIHFYQKFGFQTTGEFATDILNFDMIRSL
jgi:diamine N-acetyltransferase